MRAAVADAPPAAAPPRRRRRRGRRPPTPRPSPRGARTAAPGAAAPRLRPSAPAAPPARTEARAAAGALVKVFAIVALILIPLGFGAYSANAAVYFVGTNDEGFVTVYRGLPYALPAGVDLYPVNYVSGVPIATLPATPPQAARRPDAALPGGRLRPRPRARARPHRSRMSARNRELFALIPASLLVTAGFAAVFIQRDDLLSDLSLTYGLIFLGLCVAAHLVLRLTLPDADPYLFPLVAVLASFGLVMLYRIDEDFARDQAQWFVVGLIVFAATIVFLRDYRVLERYRYMIALGGILLLLLPRLGQPGQRRVPRLQPRADHLPARRAGEDRDHHLPRELPARHAPGARHGARRFAGITFPPLKHLGPLLVVWGAAMVLLVFIRDLGSSLMFFGGFLALVYVATNRISFVAHRPGAVRAGARVLYAIRPRREPHRRLAAPVRPRALRAGDRRQLPDRAVDLRAGRRRAVRPGLRPGAPPARRQPAAPAGRADRPHLRAHHQRARACSARSRCCSSTC